MESNHNHDHSAGDWADNLKAVMQQLLHISRMSIDDFNDFLRQVLELDADTLKVKRVSMWRWNGNDSEAMVCTDCFEPPSKEHRQGMRLQKSSYPRYFAALSEYYNLVVNDARNDERTSELTNDYLVPQDIYSMLNVPLRRSGKLIGVICHEYTGELHQWSEIEQEFAGEIAEMIIATLENNERRKAEAALRESERYLRRAQAIMHMGCWHWNLADGKVYWSEEMCRIFGLAPAAPPENVDEASRLIHQEDRIYRQQVLDKAAAGEEFPPYEVRVEWPNGETHTIIVHEVDVERDVNNQPVRIFGTAQDITEQKATQYALHKSEERMRLFFERQIVGMAISDPNHRWLQFNDRFCQMFGYSRDAMMHHSWPILLHVDDWSRFNSMFHKMVMGKINSFSLEIRGMRADAEIIYVVLSVGCVRHLSGCLDYILTLMEDISSRKKAEFELAALNAGRDRFFSVITHDLRSLFHGILGFSDMLTAELHSGDSDAIEGYVETINRAAHQTYHMLNGLIDWANLQRGLIPFAPAPLRLNDLMKEELDAFQHSAARKDIHLEVVVPSNFSVNADQNMVKLILRNLVSNAIKFTRKGGLITLKATINSDNEAEISVCDNGVGMTPQMLSRLFKLEAAFSTAGTANEKGSGLGLLLSFDLVKMHGGKIWAISESDRGSCFHFTLPLANGLNNPSTDISAEDRT